jgi:hypothetical protein
MDGIIIHPDGKRATIDQGLIVLLQMLILCLALLIWLLSVIGAKRQDHEKCKKFKDLGSNGC